MDTYRCRVYRWSCASVLHIQSFIWINIYVSIDNIADIDDIVDIVGITAKIVLVNDKLISYHLN